MKKATKNPEENAKETEVKFSPCPFCGSDNIVGFVAYERGVVRVYCGNCAVNTGDRLCVKDAFLAWNRRPERKKSG